MTIPILTRQSWREFRGGLRNPGINASTHLAKIADLSGKLHDCYVKPLPLATPSLLAETIGWLLARAANVNCAPFAGIVFVPLDELKSCMPLPPPPFPQTGEAPAWFCEVIPGRALRQIHKWKLLAEQHKCLRSKDVRRIAAFDLWTDLRDRNYGNVIRGANGSYYSIDHESLLHDVLWLPTGTSWSANSLLTEAQKLFHSTDFQRFQVEMAQAAKGHAAALATASADIKASIHQLLQPSGAATLEPLTLNALQARAQAGWLANTLGVIA